MVMMTKIPTRESLAPDCCTLLMIHSTITQSSKPKKFIPDHKPRSTRAKLSKGVGGRVPNITPSLLKKHLERFMNQNRSGPKLVMEKGTEGVLMERCMEYLETLTDEAEQLGRPHRISESDMLQVMKLCVYLC